MLRDSTLCALTKTNNDTEQMYYITYNTYSIHYKRTQGRKRLWSHPRMLWNERDHRHDHSCFTCNKSTDNHYKHIEPSYIYSKWERINNYKGMMLNHRCTRVPISIVLRNQHQHQSTCGMLTMTDRLLKSFWFHKSPDFMIFNIQWNKYK